MNTDTVTSTLPPLIERLVAQHGATCVTPDELDDWLSGGGDRVLLLAGDAVRFPEGQDVAAVLPELRRCASRTFEIAVAAPADEETLARRYGSQRWPALVFSRGGDYVTTLAGMHDWQPFLQQIEQALASPTGRAPTVGIPVVAANSGSTACH